MLNTSKLRNVYSRRNVTHVCFNGFLIGPESNEATEIPAGAEVTVTPIAMKTGLVFEVFMPLEGEPGVRETWVARRVPGDGRRPNRKRTAKLLAPVLDEVAEKTGE